MIPVILATGFADFELSVLICLCLGLTRRFDLGTIFLGSVSHETSINRFAKGVLRAMSLNEHPERKMGIAERVLPTTRVPSM